MITVIIISLTIARINATLQPYWPRNSPVAQPEDVAHHGHHGQGAGVIGPPVEPHLVDK